MSGPETVFAAILIIFGVATLLCVGAALWTARRGPSSGEREAVGEAPRARPAGCCLPAADSDGAEHDPWCHRRPPAVVAGSDLDPLEALYRAPAFNGERAFRTPGERAS